MLPPNMVPIANASASDTTGYVNTPVTFDASNSYDEDGEITNYTWNFGDGNTGYGVITTHIYDKIGVYTVKLTVTDDVDVSSSDSFKLIISIPSNSPTAPQIDGPRAGRQNIEYSFTFLSTDPDDDTIKYVIDWGDGQTEETEFLASGTQYSQQHIWTSAGIFKIRVYAADSTNKSSPSAELNILIDVIYCGALGYLIDENSDGTYDSFYSNQTGMKTVVQKQADGSYLLNTDSDSDWDYIYNVETGALTAYSKSEPDTTSQNDLTYAMLVAIIIAILLIFLIVALARKNKGKTKTKKEEKDKKKEK